MSDTPKNTQDTPSSDEQKEQGEPAVTETAQNTPEEAVAEPAAAEPTEAEIAKQAADAAQEAALPAEEVAPLQLRAGMTIRVHLKIKEGEKERIQVFQGIITALRGKTPETKTMTVQKNSFGVTVEKIFPLASPLIDKIEVVKTAKVRRSKLYFLSDYTKRLKETLIKKS